jgi:hypothetical protein
MSAQQLTSGGVLFEISDSGVGVSPARLAELNHRLDNPPIIDESVGRHMGLFAVAHLAARHGVRVRLRPGAPRGLTALVASGHPDRARHPLVRRVGATSRRSRGPSGPGDEHRSRRGSRGCSRGHAPAGAGRPAAGLQLVPEPPAVRSRRRRPSPARRLG